MVGRRGVGSRGMLSRLFEIRLGNVACVGRINALKDDY